ncbi:sigma-54-dependent Fis family transcriptional regulator [Anaerobacillus arseniciselenatis]|uniref:Sigma-54-dependent Fis family transcriptional regulator n=1 Tax=Anaerobacillus arseniciselenatis TaxID=85682 RepID=A0A1S2LU03_9BACI|nr:sigma 54-interacting transcriptional regulator [Anaerobacillus arseniciselenatis]OIJ16012.1 sigma-54-dependent Fis family transcriptional regulator [Anaerobacillus arseniciselenatis]
MKNCLIVGAGRGGSALLKILVDADMMEVIGVADKNEKSSGILLAKELGIKTDRDWECLLTNDVDVVVEATGDPALASELKVACDKAGVVLIPSSVATLIFNLIEEKETLIEQLTNYYSKQDVIINSTHDGMIAIDEKSMVTLINKSAERMLNVKKEEVLGKSIYEIVPASRLGRVLQTKKIEMNKKQEITNGLTIVTTRVPMIHNDKVIGALAVFKDITEIEQMAEEVTNLKSIQTMLEAIFSSSDDAISVVDENGIGLMINPAYTRLTGLTAGQVIGKPATADISEGESMHMHVLKNRKSVRGTRMKVGPKKKDVVVNVAPVIVDGKLKGSVGVLHDMSEIKSLTDELERARRIIRTLEAKYSFEDIIGTSEEMEFAIEQAKLAASTPATILLRGESGTGKELFAHAIHNASERKYNKFVRVNCAAISESLLESELFGYEEGAFSGAKRGGKRGLFEDANGGSIFLDEIGELSVNIQAKLLRVLQEREIVRVGGTKSIAINVRVIAATNVNLEKAINENSFREDLYYRINRMPIFIPSLRKRKEDIPALCNHLILKINQDYGRKVTGLTASAEKILMNYDWPGNVRELENVLGRAMIFMHFNEIEIDVHHIPELSGEDSKEERSEEMTQQFASFQSLAEKVQQFEKEQILFALKNNGGNKTATAKSLKLSIRNLYYKMEKYNIEINSMQ